MSTPPGTGTVPIYLAGTWKADPSRSTIGFSVRLLTVGKARGKFSSYNVMIVTGRYPLGSSVTATIDLASIDTGKKRRDDHLRSADFLSVQEHPSMSYRSTGIQRHDDDVSVIKGELTLHGITRSVPLTVTAHRFDPHTHRATFTATAQVNRSDFGIDRWSGPAAIGDKVSITLQIEAVRQE